MKIIRNIIVAFSLYSRIPMPQFAWKEDDMKYTIGFLPLIGLVIGACEYGAMHVCYSLDLPLIVRVAIWMLIPILITGGFHIDGFMDVMDAIKSYKSPAEKLEILKDPHIGAFSVISLAEYGLIYVIASALVLTDAPDYANILIAAASFFLIRAVAAILSIKCKHAKASGMLHEETKSSDTVTFIMSLVQAIIGLGVIGLVNICVALIIMLAVAIYTALFIRKSYKEFGGVTGDMIGCYITIAELVVMICVAVI